MKSAASTRPADAGFTLIEPLVALALLAMMATVVLGATTAVGHVARQSDRQLTATDQIIAAQIVLHDRIKAMRAVRRVDLSQPLVEIAGTETALEFSAPSAANQTPLTGLRRYRLLLTAPGDLVLFDLPELSTAVDANDPALNGWLPHVLVRGVSAIDIAYFGRMPNARDAAWHQFWRETSRLPDLIRIRVQFSEGDARHWPDLYVRPLSTRDFACDANVANSDCAG